MVDIQGLSHIVIKKKELSALNDFFNYVSYVNETLLDTLLEIANDEIDATKKFIETTESKHISFVRFFDVQNFVRRSQKGVKILTISYPTRPVSTSTSPFIIKLFSLFLGCMIGVFIVIVRDSYSKRVR